MFDKVRHVPLRAVGWVAAEVHGATEPMRSRGSMRHGSGQPIRRMTVRGMARPAMARADAWLCRQRDPADLRLRLARGGPARATCPGCPSNTQSQCGAIITRCSRGEPSAAPLPALPGRAGDSDHLCGALSAHLWFAKTWFQAARTPPRPRWALLRLSIGGFFPVEI